MMMVTMKMMMMVTMMMMKVTVVIMMMKVIMVMMMMKVTVVMMMMKVTMLCHPKHSLSAAAGCRCHRVTWVTPELMAGAQG